MNELHPLTRARAYVQDLINGRWGDWWGYSNSQDMRTHAKESEPNRKMNALNWFYQIDLQHHLQHQVKACRLAERSNECINACASAH